MLLESLVTMIWFNTQHLYRVCLILSGILIYTTFREFVVLPSLGVWLSLWFLFLLLTLFPMLVTVVGTETEIVERYDHFERWTTTL
jgi:hypothetical protein